MDYVRSLPDASQTPRAIVVSDFVRIRFYDLARDCALTEFALRDLRKYVTLFGFMIGADGDADVREQDPVNRKAAEKMARLHDAMKAVGYAGHPLEVYLVRLLFCLFAEDTGIFSPNQFSHFIRQENILKLIKPLFLDRLRDEFEAITGMSHTERRRIPTLRASATSREKRLRLAAFHDLIARLSFLDPACGCGNFLLVAYRELRRLEMDVLEEIHRDSPEQFLDVSQLCKVNVSQFHGIEIEAFPAEIAKVALWLMDHLCNMEVADRFGQYFARIPIQDAPHIVCANALTSEWPRTDHILGNPPFLGAMRILDSQKPDMERVFGKRQKMLGELEISVRAGRAETAFFAS